MEVNRTTERLKRNKVIGEDGIENGSLIFGGEGVKRGNVKGL